MKTEHTPQTNRRDFLNILGLSGAGIAGASLLGLPQTQAQETASEPAPEKPLIDSPPVLQCPTENSISLVWAVNQQALGSVQYGEDKEKLDQTAYGDVNGLKANDDRFLQVRIEGLQPNKRYYYRTVTTPFIFHHSHKLESKEPVSSDVYSFVTPGPNKPEGSFSSINDTHNNQATLKRLLPKVNEIGSDYTIWNGDIVSAYDRADQAVEAILRPGNVPFATEQPMLFVAGNHDHRGVWARNLHQAVPYWDHAAAEDRKLTRNFVVRSGPLVLIGLDTGEDKPDWHPAWAGQALFEPYRIAQRDWLKRVLESPAVASAPFVVTFAHIPIFDARPDANGGDVMDRWAHFQRNCGNLWGPLLNEYGVQLHVAGHMHKFRYDKPDENRKWAQVVGGGHDPKGQITVIHGKADATKMELVVDEINSGKELGRWTFEKRKNT